MADHHVEHFPQVVQVAADLIRHFEVSRRWSDESACAGMSVGGSLTRQRMPCSASSRPSQPSGTVRPRCCGP